VIHSDRSKHDYLNPIPNSRIRPRCGFVDGGDGVWVGILFCTGFQGDLRSFYILSILLLISYLSFTSGFSFFLLLKLEEEGGPWGRVSTVWVREVTTKGGHLRRPPTLLHPRWIWYCTCIWQYSRFRVTSNVLITSFEYMELILTSGTLKNFRFLMRSCLSTDRAPVIKLICSTCQPCRCITVLMTPRRDTYWFSTVLLTLIRYRSQTSDILLCSKIQKIPAVLPTGGRTAIPSGHIHQKLSPWNTCSISYPVSDSDTVYPWIRMWCHPLYYSLEAFLAWDTQKLPFWSR
jgi:hypothetical protein